MEEVIEIGVAADYDWDRRPVRLAQGSGWIGMAHEQWVEIGRAAGTLSDDNPTLDVEIDHLTHDGPLVGVQLVRETWSWKAATCDGAQLGAHCGSIGLWRRTHGPAAHD